MIRLFTSPAASDSADHAAAPEKHSARRKFTGKFAGKFVTALSAIAIATASLGAAPAQASRSDVANTVAGLALLFIVGSALNKANRSHAAPAPTRRAPAQIPRYRYYPRAARSVLPLQCVRWADTRYGTKRILASRCIERRVGEITLPRQCRRQFWNGRGRERIGYGRNCLINRGYRISSISR